MNWRISFEKDTMPRCAALILGSAVLAFGLYEVHAVSGVTEGGVLGLTLLLDRWLRISPAISGFVLNLLCYAFGTFWFLHISMNSGNTYGLMTALGMCVIPFIIPDLCKLFLACALSKRLKPLLKVRL